MPMSHRIAKWTLAELHRLPDDGHKYELVHGELFVTPAPTVRHEALANGLARLLDRYVEAQHLGFVWRSRSVVRIGRSEVEPDLWVAPGPTRLQKSWAKLPRPILVVEILSDSTRRRDHVQKRTFYLDQGVPAYWIVDGEDRTICSARRGEDDVVTNERLVWEPAGASEPLVIDVRAFFRGALGVDAIG